MKNSPTVEQFWYWNDKIAFNWIVGIRQIIVLLKEFGNIDSFHRAYISWQSDFIMNEGFSTRKTEWWKYKDVPKSWS